MWQGLHPDFFPFGPSQGDASVQKVDDFSAPVVHPRYSIPFYGTNQRTIIVNTNGHITFEQGVSTYTPHTFPFSNSPHMIAPFFADIDIRNGGSIWYRQTEDRDVLEKANQWIISTHRADCEYREFNASWAFIVTWYDVAFFGASAAGRAKRNTFQAAIILDETKTKTVVIYNYHKIEWLTGTASGGNRTTGLNGTMAQGGFDAGDGRNYFNIYGSMTEFMLNLPYTSNVNVAGRWIFRIDADDIVDLCPTLAPPPTYLIPAGNYSEVPVVVPGRSTVIPLVTTDLTLVTSPQHVTSGVTHEVEVNCTFHFHVATDFGQILSLILSKTSSVGSSDYQEIATITAFNRHQVNLPSSYNVTVVSGYLSDHSDSYIVLKWVEPDDTSEGLYKCMAEGIDTLGHIKVSTATAQVSQAGVTLPGALDRIRELEQLLLENREDCDDKITNLTSTINDYLSQVLSLQRFQQALAGKDISELQYILPTYQGHSYFLSEGLPSNNLSNSQQQCRMLGGYLVEVNNRAEYDVLLNFFRSNRVDGYNILLGATDVTSVGHWYFLNSYSPAFLDWAPDSPTYTSGYNCLYMHFRGHAGMWDYLCSYPSRFLCEFEF